MALSSLADYYKCHGQGFVSESIIQLRVYRCWCHSAPAEVIVVIEREALATELIIAFGDGRKRVGCWLKKRILADGVQVVRKQN